MTEGTGPVDPAGLREKVVAAIKTCYDPEIPVNIYDLGLIYDVLADESGAVVVNMTLTTPFCAAAQTLPAEVQYKVKTVPGVTAARVNVVWDPPWTKDMVSEEAKLQLGIF